MSRTDPCQMRSHHNAIYKSKHCIIPHKYVPMRHIRCFYTSEWDLDFLRTPLSFFFLFFFFYWRFIFKWQFLVTPYVPFPSPRPAPQLWGHPPWWPMGRACHPKALNPSRSTQAFTEIWRTDKKQMEEALWSCTVNEQRMQNAKNAKHIKCSFSPRSA